MYIYVHIIIGKSKSNLWYCDDLVSVKGQKFIAGLFDDIV